MTASTMAELAEQARAKIPPVRVDVKRKPVGRTTGYEVRCSDVEHGTMPVLAPSSRAGVLAAKTHVEREHSSRGDVFLDGRLVATSKRGKPRTAGYEDAPRRTRRLVGLR